MEIADGPQQEEKAVLVVSSRQASLKIVRGHTRIRRRPQIRSSSPAKEIVLYR